MKYLKTCAATFVAAGLFGTNSVLAADEAEAASPWKSAAELGYVVTSGNSETSSFNAKFDATHEVEKWRNNIHAEAYSASATDDATGIEDRSAERYQLSGKSDYKFSKFNYGFLLLNYDKDRFSGYDYQATLALGYGRRLLNEPGMKLDLEIGPGVRREKEKDKDPVTGLPVTNTNGILRLAAKFEWKVSDTTTFTEDLSSDIAEDNTVSKSVTALTTKINSKLAMKVTLTVRNNSEVPVGTEETDTETSVNLVYSF